MSENISGYVGIYSFPSVEDKRNQDSIYCVSNRDAKSITMVPMTPSFLETALKIAKSNKFNKFYIIIPTLDTRVVSDVYALWNLLTNYYRKDVLVITLGIYREFFCDQYNEFYTSIFWCADRQTYNMGNFYNNDFNMSFALSIYQTPACKYCGDVWIGDGNKNVVLSNHMTSGKLEEYQEESKANTYDEFHLQYDTTPYGGYTYNAMKLDAKPSFTAKMRAYGFHTQESIGEAVTYHGCQLGDVITDVLI